MLPVSVLVKPVSGSCDMRCRYCFYADEMERRKVADRGVMAPEVAETLIRRVFDLADGPVSFVFQGGEPTLAGAGFYRRFFETVRKRNVRDLTVSLSIQTNGYGLEEAFFELFRKWNVLVGVSLDGVRETHDAARTDRSGNGTYDRVRQTLTRLLKEGIDCNVLTVLTDETAARIGEIWASYRELNVPSVQFIKHVPPFGGEGGLLSPEGLEAFLLTGFDLYDEAIRLGRYLSVREFDNYVLMASGAAPESCDMAGRCSVQPVVEADGDVYPCDFYALDEWKLGNVLETDLFTMLNGAAAHAFVSGSLRADPSCRGCRWYRLCRGGCARYRDGQGERTPYRYCGAYRAFFEQRSKRIGELAARFLAGEIIKGGEEPPGPDGKNDR